MTAINMDLLKSQNDVLHRLISSHLNIGQAFGEVEIDLAADLPVDLTMRLLKWLERQPKPAPPPTVVPQEPQIDFAELEKERNIDMQIRADEATARARLDWYVANERLEPSDTNLAIITNWLKQHAGGYFSATNIHHAVAACRSVLHFTPLPPAPPVPVKLKDGTTQLPLDADERTMKRASTVQLYDLNARRREASKQQFRDNSARYQGNFGSQF